MQELDENKSLEVVDAIGSYHLSTISEKLRSLSFATAVWAVVQDCADGVPALRHVTMKEVEKFLNIAADGLWFVRRLFTCFLMLPGRVDVTRRSKKVVTSLSNDGDGHRVYEYWDKAKGRVLIAEPPDHVDVSDLLAVVVSRILGSPVCLPINGLFKSPLGSEGSLKSLLRLGPHHGGEKGSVQPSGVPGSVVVAADAALVQCHPLRPFHAGEIVAWRSDGDGSSNLRYGRVVEDVRASAGQALYRLQVETRPGEIQLVLSSNVLSFKGTSAVKEQNDLHETSSSTPEPVSSVPPAQSERPLLGTDAESTTTNTQVYTDQVMARRPASPICLYVHVHLSLSFFLSLSLLLF